MSCVCVFPVVRYEDKRSNMFCIFSVVFLFSRGRQPIGGVLHMHLSLISVPHCYRTFFLLCFCFGEAGNLLVVAHGLSVYRVLYTKFHTCVACM